MMPFTAIRTAQRRTQTALRRFSLAPLLPSFWDVAFLAGIALIGWVLYQLTPLLAETWAGVVLVVPGLVRGLKGAR